MASLAACKMCESRAAPASLPEHTAPRATLSASEDLNRTYLLSADQTEPGW